jgi:hypothetical protein
MSDFDVVLAERNGLGRIHLCGCNSVHLKIGPVTVCLAPTAFAQAAAMIREAMARLAEIAEAGRSEEPSKDSQQLVQ